MGFEIADADHEWIKADNIGIVDMVPPKRQAMTSRAPV